MPGLHVTQNRVATRCFSVADLPAGHKRRDDFYQLLGYLVGARSGSAVHAITGVPAEVTHDQLTALCAAAATAGAFGMVHVVGVTPEAPDLATTCHGDSVDVQSITVDDLVYARESLGSIDPDQQLDAVCLGTPHFSVTEFKGVARLFADAGKPHPDTAVLITTNRHVLEQISASNVRAALDDLGVTILTDVCSYNTRVLPDGVETVMTNSAKVGALAFRVFASCSEASGSAWFPPSEEGSGVAASPELALDAIPLTTGSGAGPVVKLLTEPLSFWGGKDPTIGTVIDAHHADRGTVIAGAVLWLPAVRGSNAGGTSCWSASVPEPLRPLLSWARAPDPLCRSDRR